MVTTPHIAVIGGSGFIGTRLISRLTELGLPLRSGDLIQSLSFPNLHTTCDVRQSASMRNILSGASAIINLAAEHRDDVRPVSRYYETNVEGARELCMAASEAGIQTIIFTSSVAVYGFQSFPADESGPFVPFNPYGETKLQAEEVYRLWAKQDPTRTLVIIRPTVVFGEGNRGNVYNLLRQIASGRFMMVGPGVNKKSMAYVDNITDALVYGLSFSSGIHIFNYVDSPDLCMNELVALVNQQLGRPHSNGPRIPLPLALTGGFILDALARVSGRTFPISAIRVRKFCESTQFNGSKIRESGFQPRFSLLEGLTNTIKAEFSSTKA